MNILTHPVHTGYQYDLAATGHEFYSLPFPQTREVFWDKASRPKPKNFHSLRSLAKAPVKFDVALIHYLRAFELIRDLDIPIICKEHCVRQKFPVPPFWQKRISYFSFASATAASRWVLPKKLERKKVIIGMGIDTNTFDGYRGDGEDVLVVSHRFRLRPNIKGLSNLRPLSAKFDITLLGNDNEGINGAVGPAKNFTELIEHYRRFKVFLNCSQLLGMSTLEAMAVGMPVVSFKPVNSPIVEHKVTGLVVNSVTEARAALRELLTNRDYALELGRNARARIQERFLPENFRNRWNTLFYRAVHEYAKNPRLNRVSQ